MSDWEEKSENSFSASKLLIESALHNESVHCSYYSCVQFGFHMMHAYIGMEVQEVERQSHGGVNKIGTHRWIRKQIFASLSNKNKDAAVDINNRIGVLAILRVKADYKHQQVGKREATRAVETAENIIQVLKNNYDI